MPRPAAIDQVIIRAVKDKYAPPGKVLRLSLVGDSLFLDICKYDETNKETKLETVEGIDVDAESFHEVIWVMLRDTIRSNKKEPI